MASAVSICSNAFLSLGAQPIASFEEGTDQAKLAANLYPDARDYVLRAYPWNCATKRVILPPLADAPAFDYARAFQLPNDWLKTLQVGYYGEEVDYRTEGLTILSDATSLPLRYIYRNENVDSWDTGLVWAMTQVMRAIFAQPVQSSGSMEELANAVLSPILRRASVADAQDDPPAEFGDYPLLQARFRGLTRGL